MSARSTNRIVFLLSLLGVVMAIYVLQSFLRQAPIVCISTGCETVRKNAAAWPFGIPIPAFGLVGYSILAASSFLKTMNNERKTISLLSNIMLGVVIFGVLFVSWFTYTELFVIRGVCMWCAISTINMYGIAFLIFLSKKYETNR